MRKKLQLAYIECDSARKSTYKKRKKGLLKKIDELSTLCGVDACAVIHSPYEPDPVVWPDRERAGRVLEQFKDLPEMDQQQKMFDHPTYLWQRVGKADHQLARLQRDNREREVLMAMRACLSGHIGLEEFNLLDLEDIGWMVDRNLKEIRIMLERFQPNNNEAAGMGQAAPPVTMMPPAGYAGFLPGQVDPHWMGI